MTDSGSALGGSSWTAPDEFRGWLVDLAERALRDDPGLQSALSRWKDELLQSALLDSVEDQADTLLARTNREIDDVIAIRHARDDLTTEQAPSPAGPAGKRLAAGTGLVLITGIPVLIWQSWPALSTAIGGIWAVVLCIVGALVLCVLGAGILIGTRADDGDMDLIFAAFGSAQLIGYSLALWHLWAGLSHNIGLFWTRLIFTVLGAVSLGVFLFALTVIAASELAGSAKIRATADMLLGLVSGLLAWSLLGSMESVPAHWPEAGAVLTAYVVGVGGLALFRFLGRTVRRMLAAVEWPAEASSLLRTDHERRLATLDRDLRSAERRWEEAATALLVQRLQAEVAKRVSPGFVTVLDQISPHGLQQMRGADYIVRTRSFGRLSAEIAGLSGGAVGLAGPRGAGKSSLLDQYRAGRIAEADTAGRQLVITESVPVTYEPRDYVLYLYGRLCQEVVAFIPAPTLSRGRSHRSRFGVSATVAITAGVVWLAVVLLGAAKLPGMQFKPPSWMGNLWVALATFAVIGVVTFLVTFATGKQSMVDSVAEESEPADLADLRRRAERRLRTVRFQQKETYGSTGKFKLPFGGERGMTNSQEFQRYPMPYPEIANELNQFLTMTTRALLRSGGSISRIPVVIVFDELDKMSDPERVQDFLNTVKSLFSLEIAGCLFLVSVSEDALARFERRGLPIRDAMDSTFDAVVPVEYLDLDDATALIADRVAGLPDPFIALLHSLGGGLPRELLRYTRSLVRHRDEKHLGAVARSLVGEDLRMKARGLGAVIARRGLAEPYASDLMKFVDDNTEPDPAALLKSVAAPPLHADQGDDLGDALHLQMEALGYLYFCATVLEAFTGVREDDYTDRRGSFDTLASARQLFAVNARLAWLTVNSFRRQWSLPEVAPPG